MELVGSPDFYSSLTFLSLVVLNIHSSFDSPCEVYFDLVGENDVFLHLLS